LRYDVVIAGSGFSGSLLGWILARHGRRVLIVDRQRHPRFAIGESSTPTADFLLAHLADRFGLRELGPLACWGTWKRAYPEVVCGKKRGFSYYRHHRGQRFQDSDNHDHSLLAAASTSDHWSDTHWLRSSVDQHLSMFARAAGAETLEQTVPGEANFDPFSSEWTIRLSSGQPGESVEAVVRSRWLVDATGAGQAVSQQVGNPFDDDWMKTRTSAIFGHFQGVRGFDEGAAGDDPFCGDDAAQHHLLETGWCWMLRMDNGITSVGLVEPEHLTGMGQCQGVTADGAGSRQYFIEALSQYPSLAGLFSDWDCRAPAAGMGFQRRLSRCRRDAAGRGWVLLPVAYGFVDPLHSSGIAHALSGVLRVAEALLLDGDRCQRAIHDYACEVSCEVRWLDLLTGGCYRAMPDFQLFCAFAAWYFMAAIEFEKQLAADPGHWPRGFLQTSDEPLRAAAARCYQLCSGCLTTTESAAVFSMMRRELEPWNRVGLLSEPLRNRLAHTAAPKYAAIAERK
jgi:FADH2 O2-dependent halogenase